MSNHSNPTLISDRSPIVEIPLLRRTRLLQRIKRGLQKGSVFVSAPAGYGKSTLLRSLIAELPNSSYLALSPADADLNVLRLRLLPILSQAAVVVLDDVHHLADATETLTWLLDCLQSSAPRWVIGGRLIPAALLDDKLPRQVVGAVLGAADLAFGANESKAILHGFDESLVTAWWQRTAGWPLALALLARQTTEKITQRGTLNTAEQLFAYLAESVFAALPSELAAFITISALPLRFTDEMLAMLLERPVAAVAALRQEVQQRNLFIETTEAQGWFKYHDFVRQYLCEQVEPVRRIEITERLVNWFETTGDLRMAVEQAIDGQLYERAAHLMNTNANHFLFDFGWHQSYKRWLTALPTSIHALFPVLLAKLGFALAFHLQLATEGLAYLSRAQELATSHSDPNMLAEVHLSFAGVYNQTGQMEKALPILHKTVHQPNLPLRLQTLAWLRLGTANAFLYRLRDARRAYTMLESVVNKLEEPRERQRFHVNIRHNRAVLIAAVRGDFTQQEGLLRQNLLVYQQESARMEDTLTGLCTLHESLGDWQALQDDLQQIKGVRLQWETNVASTQNVISTQPENPATEYVMKARWEMFYWAIHDASQGDFASAQRLAATFAAEVADPEAIACGQWLQAWLFRCQRRYRDCIAFVDALAPQDNESTRFYRAAIAFERASAALLANEAAWQAGIESHLRFHMQIGAKHYLLRWRILFALACYREQNPTWRKHVIFALCAIRRYGYDRLLIQREPELAAHFWALCLAENIQLAAALAALTEIGRTEPLFELLRQPSPAVRSRAIQAIAAIGNEASVPLLAAALTGEKEANVRAAIEKALDRLETSPPPTIWVTLMGEFSLIRGNTPITPDDWQRPAARRLFQYFVLNQGKPLPRDRILDELWPDSDPTTARGSFKSVYSLLRIAIEPYLRPKSPSRYVQVEQETYTLNPHNNPAILRSDIGEFAKVVGAILKEADAHDIRPLPTTFVAALEEWKPLIPALGYEAWAIEARERLQNLYIAGCLYAADALLDIDKPNDAAHWAERVIAIAPWSEEAWQQLIRAQSRQGKRTIALKSYETAVITLKRELDAPPSSILQWLAKRLRADESI